MTIASQTRKAGPFNGNDVTTAFPFTFKVFTAANLLVVEADDDGVESTLVLTSDYTVSLNANQNTNPGGTVTLNSALATGHVLVITSDIGYLQPTDLTNQGGFYPTVINDALDRLTIQTQQLKEQVDRSAKLPITNSEDADALVADIVLLADNVTPINTVAGAISSVQTVATNIANVGTVAGIDTEVTTVAGIAANVTTVAGIDTEVTTVAGIAADVGTVADVAAGVAAVAAIDDDVTTVAGIAAAVQTAANNVDDITNFADVYIGASASDPTTRTDTSALQAGDLYFNTSIGRMKVYTGVAWSETPNGSMSVQTFSGDGTETDFALASAPASENNTQVFVGGVYQQKSEYSISGTTLTFGTAPIAGTDNIEVVVVSTFPMGETSSDLVEYTPLAGPAVSVEDVLRTMMPTTATIAALRGLTVGTDSARVYVKAHTTAGDGGHGVFRWVSGASAATYVDNGGTIIVPTGGDGSAAWLREYAGAVNVLWFDGDFSTKFAAALALGNDVLVPQGSYTGDITISGTGRTIVFEDVALTGDITVTAFYHSTVRGRCSCTDLRIFGIQNCTLEALRGDFMYIQNRVGVSGVYWNVFKSLSFNALQVRQAALTSGTSAINQNAFRDCTFKGGHDNNTFTDADTNAVGVNVWLRDEVAEVAEGGTYPTYTEDYTEGSFSGSAKWDALYTNPFEFDGFDFSYSDGFGTTPDISWGIKNESTTSCEPWLKNGFIEDVDRAYSGAECNAINVEVRDAVIYKTPGDHQTSAGRVESGSLLVPIIPAWDNFELKKALVGVTTTGTISYVAPDDVPYPTVMSMGGVAIKLDNSAAGSTSTAWWTLVFEAKFTGPVNFVVRGVNYNNISIQVNSGSIVFNTSMQNPSDDEEGYESIMVTCEAGDTITCRIYPPTSGIAYITGVGAFYGKNFMALTQPTEEQFPRVDVGVSSTSTSAWNTCAVIGIGNRQKDQIRAKLFGTLSGTGGFRAEIEFKVEADAAGTVTVTSVNNMVTPSSAGVTIAVAVQAVATAANTVEIQVQKGFYGSSINSVSFRAFSRKIGVATVTIGGDSYTTRLQRNFYGD